jgi:hypothetical protein
MLAGLRAAPEDFESLSADFDRLLDRIVIADSDYALAEAAPVAQSCRVAPEEFAQASTVAPTALKARKRTKARKEQASPAQPSSSVASDSAAGTPASAAAFTGTSPGSATGPTAAPPASPASVEPTPAEPASEEVHGF